MAVFLSFCFVAAVFNGGHEIIIDHSTKPPTLHIVGQFRDTLPAMLIALLSLFSIHSGIWKHKAFGETVGWLILLGFIFAGMIFA